MVFSTLDVVGRMRGNTYMKQWTKSIEISASIEEVWLYVDGDLEKMQQLMPNVVSNTPVNITDTKVGSIYLQEYREGNRTETYNVHVDEYENTPEFKKMKVSFTLAKLFDITAAYEVLAITESSTKLTYTTSNRALKWFVHLFLFFASEKPIVKFVEHVKQVVEGNRD